MYKLVNLSTDINNMNKCDDDDYYILVIITYR